MGLFDKIFNDDEKQKQETARRKAAEKYAEEHTHAAPAKKTTVKAAAKKAPAKTAPAKKTATVPRQVAPHLHNAEAPNHTHGASTAAAATAAHDQAMTLHILSHIPDHAPREELPRRPPCVEGSRAGGSRTGLTHSSPHLSISTYVQASYTLLCWQSIAKA